jgi:hypothetical protein
VEGIVESRFRIAQNADGPVEQRIAARRRVGRPGRLVWKDARSATRFASVLIRDVSETGAYVECLNGTPIPLYRLVFLQPEQGRQHQDELPVLRQTKILAAVYRIDSPRPSSGTPQGYALRLLIEPRRAVASRHGFRRDSAAEPARASA